ncbi:MAG: hypothetical protein FJY85_00750 [Deltaproteobacteria bacterium]|nr:hypothetical protein [Deltaproteobacteria bacterium]
MTVYSDREKVETWEDLDDLVKRLYGPAPVINRIVSVQRWRVIEIKKRYAVQNV